jgi:hypothetical protein
MSMQMLQTQEKEMAKLMFGNRKMTDFMRLHCFGFEVSSCVQQLVITPNASRCCYNFFFPD